jgi:2-dehydro-3-deoxy-D-arabinonate dehydratase
MKLARYSLPDGGAGVGRIDDDRLIPLRGEGPTSLTLSEILEADDPQAFAQSHVGPASAAIPLDSVSLLPPIDRQEVWAAGVTYKRSRSARMEESAASASCYDRVYSSPRPELFMKATPHRVSGPGQPLRIRGDSKWNVPEPELTLVISSRKVLVGFTVGNDMSSRDIEGENPLYLPQAKVYDNCCGLGPWITLAGAMPPPNEIGIRLEIRRAGERVFAGETSVAQMARSFENLIGWLGRDNSFPTGVFLLTGTGVVPPSDFTLQAGDEVSISIDGIGTLTNPIVQGPANAE